MFWAPEALPIVLTVGIARTDSPTYQLDLASADLRRAADGWHAVVRLGSTTHRLWLPKLPKQRPIAVELPFDADFAVRANAAHRFCASLGRQQMRPPLPRPSVQRRERLTLALRAFDGRNEGSSYRTIAEALFGESRVTARAWKTHDVRSRTIRLVQTGIDLVRGGYRSLLRMRRDEQ